MKQYVDKSALVAEIKKIEHETNYEPFTDEVFGKRYVCKSLLSFIDTLEVKEVGFDLGSPNGDIGAKTIWDKNKIVSVSEPSSNLEEEINAYMDNEMKFLSDEIGYDTFSTIAKYFFELGLKVQKGE